MNKNENPGELSKKNPRQEHKAPGLLLIGVGTILSSTVIAGFLLGYVVDIWLETLPIFLLSFGLLGLIGGILKVYRMLIDPSLN